MVVAKLGNTRISGVVTNVSRWEITDKFDILNKMETTSSESKEKLERSEKGW